MASTTSAAAPEPAAPLMVMVTGARSQIGKSTVALALLMALVRSGAYAPADLAYIKPATQCQRRADLVAKWCHWAGVAHGGLGPIVYRPGFSYEVIEGRISPPALIQAVREAVAAVAAGRRLVVVDGVGYPSVGSCTGTSNAEMARALSVPVIFVAPPGVGDPIDSLNLALAYFRSHGVDVIGAVVNRVSTAPDARHTPDKCQKYVRMYCQRHHPGLGLYGFLPDLPAAAAAAARVATSCSLDDLEITDTDRVRLRCVEAELSPRLDIASLLDRLRSGPLEQRIAEDGASSALD